MSGVASGTGTNQEAVRRHNLGTLLRHVHHTGQMSRAELTGLMGLNRSTIAGLVAELESLGITERAGPAAGPKQAAKQAGRPSAGVRLVDHGPYVIAVDLGVDRAVVARVGLGGNVHARALTEIHADTEAWQVGAAVAALARRVVADTPDDAPLVGIGISVPGMVRRSDGLVRQAPNLGWHDVSFGSIVLAALGIDVPVWLGNDADLGALAEHRRGAGVGVEDLVYVSGNVGVGAGVVSGGAPLGGAGGYAGEVGHLRFNPEGRPCHCGNRGCWETEVGAHAIAEALSLAPSKVAALGEVLDDAAVVATPALCEIGLALGRGLAGLVNAFNPRLVVLGGYFRPLFRLVRAEVHAGLAELALPAPLESVSLSLPDLGADSVLLGAGELAFEPLFADPVAGLASGVVAAGPRLAG